VRVIADLPLGINIYNFAAQLITFLIVLFVLWRWAFPALFKTLDQREAEIRSGVENAAKARQDLAEAQTRVEGLLEQARQDAQTTLAKATQAAEHVRTEIEQEARERSQQILDQTERRIRQEIDRARAQLRQEVADLAIQAAEHVVGGSLDQTTSRRLVNEFVTQSRELQC
jgi:F-type H+-transporting ATPase subunit b